MNTNPFQPDRPQSFPTNDTPDKSGEKPLEAYVTNGLSVSEQERSRVAWQKARDRVHNISRSAVVPRDESKMTEAAKAYSEQLRIFNSSPEPTRLAKVLNSLETLIRRDPRRQVIPYEEARIIVDRIIQLETERKGRLPLTDPYTEQVFEDVTRYFIGDPDSPIPLQKNLFIYGNTGVGKDFLMKVMSYLCQVVPIPEMQFETVATKYLLRQVSKAKNLSPLDRYEKGPLLLEDLGDERKLVHLYKDDENPIDHLLTTRYIGFTKSNLRTHITSNLMPDEVEKRYGTRLYDRFMEMFEPVFYEGSSKRQDPEKPESPDDQPVDGDTNYDDSY